MNSFGISTDETLRETARHGSDQYPFQYYFEDIWAFDFHCIDWHWHRELELLYVQEGTALCCVGSERIELPAGRGLFVNSGVLHRFEAQGRTIVPNIVFSPALLAAENSLLYEKFIRPVTDCAVACQALSPDVPWQSDALGLLRELMSAQAATEVSELTTVSRLLALWQLLFDHLALSEDARAAREPSLRQARLRLMMQFIHDNYARELTLDEIAASASVGVSSALHVFQEGIHRSPVAYLIQYRLSQAARLLSGTQEMVASIAEEVGFSNSGYFCRKFRESYHMTPNEYRRKSRGE